MVTLAKVPAPGLFRVAADVVRANGWNQHVFVQRRPGWPLGACPVCVFGALNIAAGSPPNVPTRATRFAVGWIVAQFPEVRADLADWNDEPGRTKADVLDLLARAAAAAESARATEAGGGRG